MPGNLRTLYKAGILAPMGLYRLGSALLHTGANPMALLRYAADKWPARFAITDEGGSCTYHALYRSATDLGAMLHTQFSMGRGSRVAIMCRNHIGLVRAIFAVAQTGAHLYLINADMSAAQIGKLCADNRIDLVIADNEFNEKLALGGFAGQIVSAQAAVADSVTNSTTRVRGGNIVVLTGGTTGQHKTAARKPGIMRFVQPFCALLSGAGLAQYQSVYIGTPVYHGFGLAALFVSVLLGSHIYLTSRFDAQRAATIVETNNVAVLVAVPLMIQRLMNHDVAALSGLRCILSGGAAIAPALVTRVLATLGPVLYNLYGTSEAGVCIMATPAQLAVAPNALGMPLPGVALSIFDADGEAVPHGETGSICVHTAWAAGSARNKWVSTGDEGYMDRYGMVYLRGRVDDMIVSGGENVYPQVVEQALALHTDIADVAVVGVADADYGHRLHAFVTTRQPVCPDALRHWLKGKVARYEMPARITVVGELPVTPLGKPDKLALLAMCAANEMVS